MKLRGPALVLMVLGTLGMLCASLAETARADAPSATVVRVDLDRTFEARFGDARHPRVGDIFSLVRDDEVIGEVTITAVSASSIVGAPVEGFLGRPKVGDRLLFLHPRQANTPNTAWINWISPDSGYRVSAPRHHVSRTRQEKRGKSAVQLSLDVFIDDAQKQSYIVEWFEVPPDFLTSAESSSEGDSAREELGKSDFHFVDKRTISYQGMVALEADFRMSDLFGRERVFVTSKRIYQLFAVSAYRELPRRAQTFFNSFQLMTSAGRPLRAPPPSVDSNAPDAPLGADRPSEQFVNGKAYLP